MTKQVVMENFESYAQKLIEEHRIPGVAIGLNRDGKRLYDHGFGFRNVEQELPVTPDTVFGIASVTKSFTCVAIMQLQEKGKLSVHDKVVKYLPEFRVQGSEAALDMTIHHFMTHTSGLPPLPSLVYANKRSFDQDPSKDDYPGLNIDGGSHDPIDTYEQLMDFIAERDIQLLGRPGDQFSYSNDAYALLGTIIERVSGQTYEAYVSEHILKPAGMANSSFDLNELQAHGNITELYATKQSEEGVHVYAAPVWWDAPAMRAAGYLKSTVNDLLNYTEIYRNGGIVGTERILTEESVEQMTYPHAQIAPGRFYGYGLMITPDYYGTTLIEHGGSLKAVSSLICAIPEKGLTGVILTNLAGVPAQNLLMGALNDAQDKPVSASHIHFDDYEMPVSELQKYVGTYASDEGMELSIAMEGDQLTFHSLGADHPIRCIGQDLFAVNIKDREDVLRFITDDHGQVIRVAFHFRQFPRKEN